MAQHLLSDENFSRKATTSLSSIKQFESEFPSLKNFSIDEMAKLRKRLAFFLNSLKAENPLFSSLQITIQKKSLDILEREHQIDCDLFIFFIKYLLHMNKNETNIHKIEILAFEVDDIKGSKTIKYSFIGELENVCDVRGLDGIEFLVYLLKIEGRWILAIISLKDQKTYLIDFMNPLLSHIDKHDLELVVQKIHTHLYKKTLKGKMVKLENLVFGGLNDFSLYVAFVLYFLMFEKWIDIQRDIASFSEGEMKAFFNKVLWLVYSIIIRNSLEKETSETNNNKLNFNNNINYGSSITNINKISDNTNNSGSGNTYSLSIEKPINGYESSSILRKKSVLFKDHNEIPQITISRKLLVSQLKQCKQEIIEEISHKKSKSNAETYFSENTIKNNIKFMKYEVDDSLTKYTKKFQEKNNTGQYLSPNKDFEMMENYQKFQNLMWFYYYYDKTAYRSLIEEYNKRLQNHLFDNLGLPPVEIPSKLQPKKQQNSEISSNQSLFPQFNPIVNDFPKSIKRRSIMKTNPKFDNGNFILKTEPSQPTKDLLAKMTRNSIIYEPLPINTLENVLGTIDVLKPERNSIKNESSTLKNIGRLSMIKPVGSSLHFTNTNTDQKILKMLSKKELDSFKNNPDYPIHRKSKSYLENNNGLISNTLNKSNTNSSISSSLQMSGYERGDPGKERVSLRSDAIKNDKKFMIKRNSIVTRINNDSKGNLISYKNNK